MPISEFCTKFAVLKLIYVQFNVVNFEFLRACISIEFQRSDFYLGFVPVA